MKSGQWTPIEDLDLETVIRQEHDGTATIFVSIDGRVIAHFDIVPVPADERSSIGYGVEIDAYAYMTDAFEGEVSPTRIHVHPFQQSSMKIDGVRS